MLQGNGSEIKLATDEIDRLALLAKNDPAAAAELIGILLPSIRAFSNRFDSLIREDLLQEGLLGALASIAEFDPEKGRAATFIIACAKNKMYSALKKNSYFGGSADDQEIAEVDDDSQYQQLYDAIDSCLSPLEKRVVWCQLMGLSYRESAQRLAIDEKSVDNAMQRARRKLRKTALDGGF